jgi:hypothetical protein
LLEHFDEDIHDLLKIKLDQAKERLDKVSRWFWAVTQYQLESHAIFEESDYCFTLNKSIPKQVEGKYQLIHKGRSHNEKEQKINEHAHKYRISHPLGEYVLENARNNPTPQKVLHFDYQNHQGKVSVAEQLKGQAGWLSLNLLRETIGVRTKLN